MPSAPVPPGFESVVDRTVEKLAVGTPLERDEQFALEAIIIPDKRPAIDIVEGNSFRIDHPLWRHLADGAARAHIEAAIPAVGRIELPGHPSIPYGGTGFVVASDLLMTNRHVAEIFAQGLGVRSLAFRTGQTAGIDFERRIDGGALYVDVDGIAMIHPYWDMALLRVSGLPASITPLRLAGRQDGDAQRDIVAIGYPAFDARNPADVQRQVFRDVYNVKRLMPGRLTGSADVPSFGKTVLASLHDSSTLGGASGSAILDPADGTVVALHFGGSYLKTNYGVPMGDLARDARVVDAGVSFAGAGPTAKGAWNEYWHLAEAAGSEGPRLDRPFASSGASSAPPVAGPACGGAVSVTIPLTVTFALGDPQSGPATPTPPSLPQAGRDGGGADVVGVECVAEDYDEREGYRPAFLGVTVPLPRVVAAAADVLDVDLGGRRDQELRYEHFSVVMNRPRRMCFFSAVNIDGGQSRKAKRVGWRRDPRIPEDRQILNECYGNPPKFSRGHMTRREDPVWGDAATSERGNGDSMCVTNTTPQMQAFNAPIWLALEDYALQHARADAMRISVFTGPYFRDDDPTMYGVRIPVAFWKVIAFIHDQTGRLCATGYEMSQRATLPPTDREFVFGQFQSPQLAIATQVPLRSIEQRGGLSFGDLPDHDPKSDGQESVAGAPPLLAMEQIEFTR